MYHKFLFVRLFLTSLILSLSLPALAWEEEELPHVRINEPRDLRDEAALSQENRKPILILFSMEGCTYCEYVEEEHLKPMLRNADYRSKVIIRRVMTDDYATLIDFNGNAVDRMDFSNRYGAFLTPTVVFIDHQGKQLAPRILGVRNTEFYGFDLEEGLKTSLRKLRGDITTAETRSSSKNLKRNASTF